MVEVSEELSECPKIRIAGMQSTILVIGGGRFVDHQDPCGPQHSQTIIVIIQFFKRRANFFKNVNSADSDQSYTWYVLIHLCRITSNHLATPLVFAYVPCFAYDVVLQFE